MRCPSCGAEFDFLFSFECPACTRQNKFLEKTGHSSAPPSNDKYLIILIIFTFFMWWLWPEQSATSIPNTANINKENNIIEQQENSSDIKSSTLDKNINEQNSSDIKSSTLDKNINEQNSSDIKSLASDNNINEQSPDNYIKTNEINNNQSPQINTETEGKIEKITTLPE
jgi:hypothetical protein